MPGPSCRVTTRALQLHSRLPAAGLMTFLSRVTCGPAQSVSGTAARELSRGTHVASASMRPAALIGQHQAIACIPATAVDFTGQLDFPYNPTWKLAPRQRSRSVASSSTITSLPLGVCSSSSSPPPKPKPRPKNLLARCEGRCCRCCADARCACLHGSLWSTAKGVWAQ